MDVSRLPLREFLEWFVEAYGYPYDTCSSVMPPEGVIEELADIWYRRDNFNIAGEPISDLTLRDYEDQIRDEIERIAGVR